MNEIPGITGAVVERKLALLKTHAQHLDSAVVSAQQPSADNSSFGDYLAQSLTQVSDLGQRHTDLTVASILDPRSVDTHDITISAAQANLSLSLARNVIDRVIGAYRELTSLR